jgi:hypothetical protein
VYATFDGHYNDDYRPYVYVSDDYGQTWRSLSAGLPETSVNRIREHPHNARFLVLAHERGVHVSNDAGASWLSLATNMPTVPTDDAVIHPRDNALIAGTHGRSIWILDDVAPLEALTTEALRTDAALIRPHPARLMSTYSPQSWFGVGQFFAPNPEWNAVISYYLREPGSSPVQVDVNDVNGNRIRTLQGPAKQGLNRVTWDLRMERPIEPDVPAVGGGGGGGGGGRGGGAPVAPLVLPGKYGVSIKLPSEHELRADLLVEPDPLVNFSERDRRTRQTALLTVYDLSKTLGVARKAARGLIAQSDSVKQDLGPGSDAARRADSVMARVPQIQGAIDRALAAASGLSRSIEGFSGLPTADQRVQLDAVIADAARSVDDLNRVILVDIPALYAAAGKRERPQRVNAVPPIRRP